MNLRPQHTIWRFPKLLLVALIFIASPIEAGVKRNAVTCDTGCLPKAIFEVLKKSFPEWRIKRMDDFDSLHQDVWIKARPGECPGFVSGHFQDNATTDYVLLLVPKQSEGTDYKVVLFSKHGNNTNLKPFVITTESNQILERVAISKVPAGNYSEAEEVAKIKLMYDGIQVANLEAGSMVYYWSNERFQKFVASE